MKHNIKQKIVNNISRTADIYKKFGTPHSPNNYTIGNANYSVQYLLLPVPYKYVVVIKICRN